MPKRMTEEQRQSILQMLARGEDRDTIAASVDVTPGQVSAIAAHVKMGRYALPSASDNEPIGMQKPSRPGIERTENLLCQLRSLGDQPASDAGTIAPVLLGTDAESGDDTFWNPDPYRGAANPHVLVLG